MFNFLRLRSFSAQRQASALFQKLESNLRVMPINGFLVRLVLPSLMVGVLATTLWLGSAGLYIQTAQAGDNLDARPYEAEAVRQSRLPNVQANSYNNADAVPSQSESSQAPEDQARGVLENVKDAIQDIVPGMSADKGVGQNAYNPNTQHNSSLQR